MRPVSGVSSSHATGAPRHVPRPSTRQRVCAGCPSGETFIHQPRDASRRPERLVDEAFVFRRAARDDRPVGLGDLALLEQQAELFQRLMMAPKHQATRSFAIEPVRERRIARQAEPQRVEIVFEALPALRPLVHRDSRRLVEDQHQAVAV